MHDNERYHKDNLKIFTGRHGNGFYRDGDLRGQRPSGMEITERPFYVAVQRSYPEVYGSVGVNLGDTPYQRLPAAVETWTKQTVRERHCVTKISLVPPQES